MSVFFFCWLVEDYNSSSFVNELKSNFHHCTWKLSYPNSYHALFKKYSSYAYLENEAQVGD